MVGGQQKVVTPYFSRSGRISVGLNFPRISYTNIQAPTIHWPKSFPGALPLPGIGECQVEVVWAQVVPQLGGDDVSEGVGVVM